MTEPILALALTAGAAAALRWLPPLHPAQLWLLPWAVAASLLALGLLPYVTLSASATALMIAGSLSFCVGALAFDPRGGRKALDWDDELEVARFAAGTALAVLAGALAAFLGQVAIQYGLRATIVASPEVRHAIGAGEFAITIKYVYASFVAATLSGLLAGLCAGHQRRFWLGIAGLASLSAYFSTGRSTIVLSGLAGTFAYLLARRSPISRGQLCAGVGVAGALTLAIFSAGGAIIGKTLEGNALSQVRSAFTDHRVLEPLALPYQYATAPLVALDVQVQVNQGRDKAQGCATLATFCSIGSAVGLTTRPEPAIEPFTSEPLPWNTYTALDRPLIDGGPFAVPLTLLLLGAGFGRLFGQARAGGPIAGAMYAVFATAIIYSSTQMNFFAPHILAGALGSGGLLLGWRVLLEHARKITPPRRGGAGAHSTFGALLRVRLGGALDRLGRRA